MFLYRDKNRGTTKQITASDTTQDKAEKKLLAKLKRQHLSGPHRGSATLSPESTVGDLTSVYLEKLDASDFAGATKTRYRQTITAHIVPEIGEIRLRELSSGRFAKLINDLAETSLSEAKIARAVCVNICKVALEHDAIEKNLAYGAAGGLSNPKKEDPRALTPDQTSRLFDQLENAKLKSKRGPTSRKGFDDLMDALLLQLATSIRISEATAIQAADVSVDDDGDTILRVHQANVYQAATGKLGPRIYENPGYQWIQPHTKAKDIRTFKLPEFAIEIVNRRIKTAGSNGLLFHTSEGRPLNLNNMRRTLRSVTGHTEFSFASTHTMRRSVATAVTNDPAHGVAVASRVLAHAELSTTIRAYVERKTETPDVRSVSSKFAWKRTPL
ncbi:tyrosine-type recombinase/integrase [Cryobacterium sp. Hz7]|uniref:tyrosine-type recombinase/integrase n=1 Tax=Cryobacterium sp. Hz7 TaxID=1259166 RepID=UPI00141BC933|nr:tyrosine-type recombinase/integrase [Cryobacterium sp. Hz7]